MSGRRAGLGFAWAVAAAMAIGVATPSAGAEAASDRAASLQGHAMQRIDRGDPLPSEAVLLELAAFASDDDVRQARRDLAGHLAEAGWIGRATRLLADAVSADPSDDATRLALAELWARWCVPAQSLAVLEPMLEGRSPDRRALRLAVFAHLAAGDGAASGRLLMRVAPGTPIERDALLSALLDLGRGQSAAALTTLEAFTDDDDLTAARLALLLEARAFEAMGDPAQARDRLVALCRRDPASPYAFERLGGWLRRHGDAAEATRLFDELASLSPVFAPIARASLAMRRGALDEAEACLGEAVRSAVERQDPGALDAAEAWAATRRERGLTTHVAFAPLAQGGWMPAAAVLRAAAWREAEGRPIGAAVYLAALGMTGVDDGPTRDAILERLFELGEGERAMAALRAACENDAADTPMRRDYARRLAERGEFDAALDVLTAAQERWPTHAGLVMQRAATQLRAGRPAEAERAWRLAMRLNPHTRRRAAGKLAAMLAALGLREDAMAALERGVSDPPEAADLELLDRHAQLAFATGRHNAAARRWGDVLALDPQHGGAALGLARLAWRDDDRPAALRRVHDLTASAPAAAAQAAMALSLDDAADRALVEAVDARLDRDALPATLARGWQAHRVQCLADRGDWEAVEATLAEMARTSHDHEQTIALLAAVRVHRGRLDAARDAVRTAGLNRPHRPDALTLAVGLESPAARSTGKLDALWLALASRDAIRAHTAVGLMPYHPTLLRHDTRTALQRVDFADPATAGIGRHLAAASVAMDHGLPTLAAAIAASVARTHAGFTPALALWADAVRQHGGPLTPILDTAGQGTTGMIEVVRAWHAMDRGDPEHAAAALTRALRAEPRNAHLLYELATAEAAAGRVDESLRRLAQLRSDHPGYREAACRKLIEVIARQRPGRFDTAARLADRLYGDQPPASVEAALARGRLARGEVDAAARGLTLAALRGGLDVEGHLAFARVHAARGDVAWSLRHLDAFAADAPAPGSGRLAVTAMAEARTLRDRLTRQAGVATE